MAKTPVGAGEDAGGQDLGGGRPAGGRADDDLIDAGDAGGDDAMRTLLVAARPPGA